MCVCGCVCICICGCVLRYYFVRFYMSVGSYCLNVILQHK